MELFDTHFFWIGQVLAFKDAYSIGLERGGGG